MEKSAKKAHRRPVFVRKGVLLLVLAIGILAIAWLLLKPKDGRPQDSRQQSESGQSEDWNRIENGIHLRTGLKEDEGLMTVVAHCTACHSAQLVIQNRMNEERWNATIRWMQETQNLWDLGENQKVIVDYLVRNYPPTEKGRRENLKDIEWYALEKE